MLTVHHLESSRSQRVLWLLEELGVPYTLGRYARDRKTLLAPPSLRAIHPLGKSPVVTDEGRTLAESGAIVEYLVERYGKGSLIPAPGTEERLRYTYWLHYAEGSAMLPLLLNMYVLRLGEAGQPLHARIESELSNHLGFVESSLTGREWLLDMGLSAADIQLSFVGEVTGAFGRLTQYPAMQAWVTRFQARPAYKTALEKGGAYSFVQG